MDAYFFKLYWKNIWRNRRRTTLTAGAIALGITALVCIHNYYDAIHEQVVGNVIRYSNGHLVVAAPGYQKQRLPSTYLKDPAPVERWLDARPEVKAWGERVAVNGLLSSARGSSNIVFMGVNPVTEPRVSHFSSTLVAGTFLTGTSGKPIVIGQALAEYLSVQVGEKVVALTQGVDGSVGNELFRVAGIFRTQSEADKSLAFVTQGDAHLLASLPAGSAHQISIVLHRDKDLEKVRKAFTQQFPPTAWEILPWTEIQQHVMALIEIDRAVNKLLMLVILFVAAMGIANSILMGIMERIREFGVMMAVGTTTRQVVRMVVVETLLLTTVGVFLGNLLGILITLYYGRVGFDLRWLTQRDLVVDGTIVQSMNYPAVHWQNSLMVTTVIMALALVVSIFPARHISRLSAVQALRTH